MKTLFKKILKTCALILCILPQVSQAQIPTTTPLNCPFYIFNHRNCDIVVHYEASDCNANLPNPGACGFGIICSNTALVIPANTSVLIPCCTAGSGIPNPGSFTSPPCWSPGGDVFVWLKEIDGKDVTGGTNAHAVTGNNCLSPGNLNATGTVPSSVSSPCNVPSTYILNWTPNGVDIF